MNDAQTIRTDDLLEAAHATVRRMAATARGKPDSTEFSLPLGSFVSVAAMLRELTEIVAAQRRATEAMTAALGRIAHLEIAGGARLFENGAWKIVSGEMQAIALDAIERSAEAPPAR